MYLSLVNALLSFISEITLYDLDVTCCYDLSFIYIVMISFLLLYSVLLYSYLFYT